MFMDKRDEQIKKLLKTSEISLKLATYNDIFSSFDPRTYPQRSLSDDFLIEAKKASRDKASGGIELELLMPREKRNLREENLIKKRLREHFKKHHDQLHKEKRGVIKQGLLFVIFGVILMFIATFILFKYHEESFFTSFLVVFLEPGAWFLFWEGLNLIIFETKKTKPELDFYEKMSKCEIDFLSY